MIKSIKSKVLNKCVKNIKNDTKSTKSVRKFHPAENPHYGIKN